MFTLFCYFFSSECVCAVYGTFASECFFRCFMLFFSSECVCAVYGTLTTDMSTLFMLFFSSECVYAVYGTFTSEYVYYVTFSEAGLITLGYM